MTLTTRMTALENVVAEQGASQARMEALLTTLVTGQAAPAAPVVKATTAKPRKAVSTPVAAPVAAPVAEGTEVTFVKRMSKDEFKALKVTGVVPAGMSQAEAREAGLIPTEVGTRTARPAKVAKVAEVVEAKPAKTAKRKPATAPKAKAVTPSKRAQRAALTATGLFTAAQIDAALKA